MFEILGKIFRVWIYCLVFSLTQCCEKRFIIKVWCQVETFQSLYQHVVCFVLLKHEAGVVQCYQEYWYRYHLVFACACVEIFSCHFWQVHFNCWVKSVLIVQLCSIYVPANVIYHSMVQIVRDNIWYDVIFFFACSIVTIIGIILYPFKCLWSTRLCPFSFFPTVTVMLSKKIP